MGNSIELVKKYLRPCYIETGIACGDSMRRACYSGIKACFGVECDPERIMLAMEELKRHKNSIFIELLQGHSENQFNKLLHDAREKFKDNEIMIFLDAHRVSKKENNETYPLLDELNIILNAKLSEAVVMIDDTRLFDSELNAPMSEVFKLVMQINPKYKIAFEDSDTHIRDILVAYL